MQTGERVMQFEQNIKFLVLQETRMTKVDILKIRSIVTLILPIVLPEVLRVILYLFGTQKLSKNQWWCIQSVLLWWKERGTLKISVI